MRIKLIIGVAIVVVFVILYFLVRGLLLLLARKRKYREVENRIRKRIKPLSKEKEGEKRYSLSEYEECIRMTKDKNVKAGAGGFWLNFTIIIPIARKITWIKQLSAIHI